MRNDSVKLTPLGKTIYLFGVGLGLTALAFGVVRVFAYVVVWTAQLLGIS